LQSRRRNALEGAVAYLAKISIKIDNKDPK